MNVTFKKTFKILGAVIAILLITVVLFVATVWFAPGLILNANNFSRYAAPVLKKDGIVITSESLQLTAGSRSFWEKDVKFGLKKACVAYDVHKPALCFDDLALDVGLNLKNLKLAGVVIRELSVHSPELNLDLRSPPKKPEKSSFNIFAWLRKIYVEKVDIDLPKISAQLATDHLQGSVTVANAPTGFFTEAHLISDDKASFDTVDVSAKRERLERLIDLLRLNEGQLQIRLGHGREAAVKLLSRSHEHEENKLSLTGSYKDTGLRTHFALKIDQKARDLKATLSGKIFLPKQLRGPIEIRNCDLSALLTQNDVRRLESKPEVANPREDQVPVDRADLLCNMNVQTKYLITEKKYISALPPKVDLRLIGTARRVAGKKATEDLNGSLRLEVGPFTNTFIQGKIAASYEINFSDAKSKFDFDPIVIDTDLQITNFFKFAQFMNAVGVLIPSPVNVLNGTVTISAKGKVSPKPLNGKVSVKLVSTLASTGQALDLDADGSLGFKACAPPQNNSIIDIDLIANNMKIRLPDVDYTHPPPITPDARFVLKKQPKPGSQCGTAYNFSFKNRDKPIIIAATALKSDLPLGVSVNAQNGQKPKGYIRIRNYVATIFRRTGTLESFDLNLETKEVSGRLRVEYTDYKVFVNVAGTTDSVEMDLQSDPPLPREQVMSLLLFGKPLEGLDPDQSGSVTNADAAAKDGALSLASLYLFASTPIESIGYNPQTNGVTAKVKLATGTSLNVGANSQGLTDVGVTRRLSKHWRIQTTLKEPNQEQGEARSAKTLLEWFNRF